MLTSTGSRLFRFLLSLVIRLRVSIGRIAIALRARLASFWRSILTFARRSGQSQIRLCANDAPVPVNNNPMGERPQISGLAMAREEDSGTLAALPVRRPARWQDELSKYQALTSSSQSHFKFDLHPATPEGGSQRYMPREVSQNADPLKEIPAGQRTLLSALPLLPDGWKRHVHPEGSVIFYHEGLRIFTESDIIDHEQEILVCATALIQQAVQTGDVILDELTEIVLNLDDSECCHYYFVDHRHRLLFWVHPVEPREHLRTDLQGVTEYSHISMFDIQLLSFTDTRLGYLIESQYWYASLDRLSGMSAPYLAYDMESRSHCEYYPHNRTLPKRVFEDLRGMLNYAKTDMMTTDSSSSPFAQDELVAILDLVNSLKVGVNGHVSSSPFLNTTLAENQFLNFCGQPCARLNADTPLFGQQTWNRRTVFQIVNILLFGSPNEHAVRLQRVWVDGIIILPRWKDFINRLTTELGRYTIFVSLSCFARPISYGSQSTVMLAVNFSFLAVPGVVIPGTPASPIQIIIYCSVVSTVGSIGFSFALLNVYSNPGLLVAGPAAEAMRTLGQVRPGMACLAITHSLPIACLIWSIALFSTALAIQIFSPKERATVTTLGVECLILVLSGFMSMVVLRLFSRDDDVDDVDIPEEEILSPTRSLPDVEQGSVGK
ncbi:hypothetical protein J3R83DRAFT_14026 [Lanmaoa asiatica]|nr:hypothetical protein J3R83DRAFT_14026 [Lanmaoa asiatica]